LERKYPIYHSLDVYGVSFSAPWAPRPCNTLPLRTTAHAKIAASKIVARYQCSLCRVFFCLYSEQFLLVKSFEHREAKPTVSTRSRSLRRQYFADLRASYAILRCNSAAAGRK